ncbi:MAG: hypothetical protein Q7T01_00395 [bacterium]|nr:hypothetical protein [bacterium]
MGRFFRGLWYFVSGQFIWGAKQLERNPAVIEAEFDSAIGKLKRRFTAAKEAVGNLIAMREKRKRDLETLTETLETHRETMDGSKALLQEVVAGLRSQGLDDAAIQQHADYLQYASAFQDAQSSADAVEADIARCEEDIKHLEQQASDYKIQLQEMQREIEKIKTEKHATIADISFATQVQQMNDALAGIGSDGVSETLASLRERRDQAKAQATLSRELSGADARVQAAKIRTAARRSRANTELAAQLGLGAKPVVETATKAAVAEAVGDSGSSKPGALPG